MKPIKYHQVSLSDIFSDLKDIFQDDKPKFIELFESYIDLNQLIPQSFFDSYYSNTGHPRDFSLVSIISSLIIQKVLSIPTTSLLINVLNLSPQLRSLCGFKRVPDAAQFSRFKTDFLKELNIFFNNLVSITEPICQKINLELSQILIADTTGFEAYVKENNPKFFETISRNIKSFSKNIPNFDVHAYACGKMPKKASSNKDISLAYINGHFCYAQKAAFITNGLGIVRHVDFYDDPNHDISSFESPQDSKDDYDSKTLIPVLNRYFSVHPNFKSTYNYFLGDSGFDAFDNYKYLVKEHNIIPVIALNPRNSKNLPEPGTNSTGTPTCPNNPNLPMKFDGITREKGRPDRIKWLCPLSKKAKIKGKTQYILSCPNPCTDSKCGRIHHTYISYNYRLNTAIPRDTEKWTKLYKKRTVIERTNASIKDSMCLGSLKLRNTESLKAEVLLACITQQIALIIASNMYDEIEHPTSIKFLVA